ncbi:MAG: L-cystine transport system permease protein TcyB [Firmicutes bacterium ADurb.Bin356]|nr:MAG: L-cystine transport system permease protein TcyB [Firmicutes bacterium ADurb.Bin356]
MNFLTVTTKLLEGFWLSCIIFFFTLFGAMPLGLLISFGSMSKFRPLKIISKGFVWVIRGTPLMLQLMIVYYGPGLMFGLTAFPKMTAVLIAFIINYTAYFSEIYRSGIEGVPRGQYEAGQVLGMTKTQIFFKIILLQVVKRIVPPMSNEIITLVKDTSLARVIALMEIIMVAFTYTTKGVIWPLFYTGVFYLVFCGGLTLLFGFIERKLDYFRV